MSILNYDTRYPGIADLKRKAKKRIPSFAFDYVDAGIDDEVGKQRNREAFHDIELIPRYLIDVGNVDTDTEIFGKRYAMPIGVAPVGLGNMMWPGAELALATAAQKANIPYVLSTFSTTDLNQIARAAPNVCWFQLYMPNEVEVMRELIGNVKQAGYKVMVVTLDIPVGAKRNRELKNGLKLPFKFTPHIIWQSMIHPIWALETLRHGQPDFVNMLKYRKDADMGLAQFVSIFNQPGVTLERIKMVRELWDGPLLLKGVQDLTNVQESIDCGVDGIIVSTHGARQLDAAPSSIDSLKQLPKHAHEKLTILIDSGVRCGLDVVRAKALGAQTAFAGRAFFYGMGAMGPKGARQVIEIFRDEITRTLQQIGCLSFDEMDGSWLSKTQD